MITYWVRETCRTDLATRFKVQSRMADMRVFQQIERVFD